MGKNRTKDLLLNTVIIGIGKFSTQIVAFLLLPLYTSILSTSEYGVYDLLITIATFLLPIITLLMEESMFRFLIDCKNEEDKKTVISQTSIYLFLSMTIFVLICIILNIFFKIPYLLIFGIYVFGLILTEIRNAIIRGLGQIKLYSTINFFTSVINICLNILFIAFLRIGITGLLLSGIISNFVTSIIVFIKLKVYKYISLKSYDKNLMKNMVKYSIPLVPNSLSWAVVNLSDRIVLSSVIGADANGVYSMSYKFPNIMNTIYGFFYTAWKESSAKVVNDDDNEHFYNSIFNYLKKAMFSISIGLIVSMPICFGFFVKEAFKEAYYYIPILVISMYYNNMAGYFGGIFSAYKNTKIMGTTTIIGAVINLVVNIALIKFIGIYAAAFSTLLSCLFIYFSRRFAVKKYLKLKSEHSILGWIILGITLVCYYYNVNVVIKIINFILVSAFAVFSNRDFIKKFIVSTLNKIKNK